ncbi:MAG TPA: hypothetical protein VH305_05375 [Gaiella sp.]|jgi:UDP-3-O-[3-hydroxymyristoyl] glucosamine N-acyltransferase
MEYNPTEKRFQIHPSARVHPTAEIGNPPEHRDWWETAADETDPEYFDVIVEEGARIGPFVTVDGGFKGNTVIGEGTWLMAHTHVGHDAVLGKDCELPPGTVIGGHCQVGDRVRFGVNVSVRPFITIGEGARIGAGSNVVKDIPAGEIWVGNPARFLRGNS